MRHHHHAPRARVFALRSALMGGIALSALAGQALAQEAAQDPTEVDEVVVTGFRASLQSSIERKREATVVADVLSAEDIGDLPALSIGEAIETITGASTHREKGAASEISIRGLGPFLGAATFNGREASNGSGDRSVNFNQFPSELINTVAIYKTQRADFVEGGVAGIINMETLRPLDFGRRRIQFEARGIYAGYDDRLRDPAGVGWRGTASYVDQFDLPGGGELGISLGVQSLEGTNPEELMTSSSTWIACNAAQVVATGSNCSQVTAAQVNSGTPYYLTAGSRTYRQFIENDQRDAIFGSVQWRPNDTFEVTLDYQSSQRTYTEERNDLNFSETTRGANNRVYGENGILLAYTGNSTIESTPTYRIRDEQYEGGGITLEWRPTDRLEVSTDISYSSTYRSEMDRQVRMRSNIRDIDGVVVPGVISANAGMTSGQRVNYSFDLRGNDVPAIVVDPLFDLDRHENFSAAARVRRDELVRENEIKAIRFDGTYQLDGAWTAVKAGARFSELTYVDVDDRVEINVSTTATIRDANLACRRDFPQEDFLSNARGNTITSWATFDARCLFTAFTGVDDTGPNADTRNIANRDVTENTAAAYVLGEFDADLFGLPVTGNVGLRYVLTDVTSVGLRGGFDVVTNPDSTIRLVPTGEFETVTIESQSEVLLPSLNIAFEVAEDKLVRFGLFRAMSRPDPSSLGAGRTFVLESGVSFPTVQAAIDSITANGNPRTPPLLSWNGDLSFEWYPNEDSLFSAAIYYKVFNGGFVPTVLNESYVIDGANVTVPVIQDTVIKDQSELFGFELTAAHRFSYLPAPFDGLGFKASYNYADSDFETQDLRLGDQFNPTTGVVTPGIVEPAGIFGLSQHVFSGSMYYEIGPFEFQGIYKYRTEYYQKFVGAPSQNRYIRDTAVFDFRASWRVNSNLSFSFEGSNLNDEPRFHDMPVPGSFREYNTYGPRYYLGARFRF
ncbi:MAG: TonB-dependent receptor [Alphaproteobacteria bacterium]|nr:TonB-dependent receptor [Alphaproteobacteria bacterium]MBU1524882.1 TonB-dependent receptor [Alphaproteobacteria bacterium]MBU2118296.1 TonB-dependent receptor [Alphaproteobacteria bacterium]MBU2350135.1 TonB-dependent receptor [Alphaproteobacteria bacterium]MBU2381936.1 TonB-dependent receptor [Alphaproteobacteria bacterium]